MDSISKQLISSVANTETVGQVLLTAASGTWICPPNVFSVSVVVIAPGSNYVLHGGSLRYKNNIPVVPGTSYSYQIPSPSSTEGLAWFISSSTVSARTGWANSQNPSLTQYGDGGGNGGGGGFGSGFGGCGAGGYSGNGGGSGAPGSGGGGAGGGNSAYGVGPGPGGVGGYNGGGGGGVGPYGIGSNGVPGTNSSYYSGPATGGGAGSSGAPGSSSGNGAGGNYGGGAGAPNTYSVEYGYPQKPMYGGYGCIRIIWPGNKRQFPSTRTADE